VAGLLLALSPCAQAQKSASPPDNRPPTYHDETLKGTGAFANPLGLADGAITASKIADGAVTAPKLATTTPPAAGQVLTFDGSMLTWQGIPDQTLPAGTSTTTLLFPFVTNQAGFDTGIAISNTSLDTVGTTPQAGKCTISYFGAAAPAAQTTTADVPAGSQLTFTVSAGGGLGIAGAPGFQGYLIATCNFQYAHGFALVTDGPIGVAKVGSSYLALVIPAGGRNPKGEQLSQ
jgi:hypothetical protein